MRIFLFKDLLFFLWDMELRASLGSFLLLPVIALSCGSTLFILLSLVFRTGMQNLLLGSFLSLESWPFLVLLWICAFFLPCFLLLIFLLWLGMFRSGVFFWLLVPYLLSILTMYLPSISRSFVWYIRLIYTCFYGESSAYLFSRIYDLGLMLNPVDLHVWFILFLPDGWCLSTAISILEVYLLMEELIWILKHKRSWDFLSLPVMDYVFGACCYVLLKPGMCMYFIPFSDECCLFAGSLI